jgi:DNA (cytosine-5)-methyltransferase 1
MSYHIADLFCGAGGTSAGAVEAIAAMGKKPIVTAVNHWNVAIATHTANHPEARHLCTGIDSINPRELFKENELDMLWASPECTHHSVARGGKPINDQSRATAWCVVRWAEALRPPVILIENVPEFATWGPIGSNNRPLASRRGETFRAWLAALESLGYKTDYRLLCAADYGDPTTRTRLFIQAVRGRRKIVWPEATHSKEGDMFATRRWVAARECIDWDLEGGSIYERKKPLSDKTLARIEAGLRKFGLKGFIVPQNSSNKARGVDSPVPTLTTTSRGVGLVEPFIVAWDHTSGGAGSGISGIGDPISTVVTKARHGLAEPFLVELRGTGKKQVEGSAKSLDQPCSAVTTSGAHHALIEPFLVKTANGISRGSEASRTKSLESPMPTVCGNRGDLALIEPHLLPQQSDGRLRPVSEPAPTVATAGAIALVEPFLVSFYGNGQPHDISDPAPTVTCKDRFGLVRPIVEVDGNRYLLDIRFRMLQPHELALAQGFPKEYRFTGNKTDQVKQIGNAVPRRLARAIVGAVTTQCSDVGWLVDLEEEKEAVA